MPATNSQPASAQRRARSGACSMQQPDRQQPERVPRVVLDRGLPDRQRIGVDARALERMRAERAGADGGEHQQRGEQRARSRADISSRIESIGAPRSAASVRIAP